MAISANGRDWLLINASPDIRQQIGATAALHPRTGCRQSPIAAVVLTNGDVDHVGGLLSLREAQPFELYASRATLDALARNVIFDVVDPIIARRQPVELDQSFEALPGLEVELFAVPGKVPLWLEKNENALGNSRENTTGVTIASGGRKMTYVPGCAAVTPDTRARLDGADLLLFDGTLWEDDEMITLGIGRKTGRRMGHLPIAGPDGTLEALAGLGARRRVFVHINNTNPVLIEDSRERRLAEAAGWEIGFDGMEFAL